MTRHVPANTRAPNTCGPHVPRNARVALYRGPFGRSAQPGGTITVSSRQEDPSLAEESR